MTDERGMSPAVEFTVLVTAFFLLIALVVGAVRVWQARVAVESLADSAARQASISRSAHQAVSDATALVQADAAASHLPCQGGVTVSVDTSGFSIPVGQPATVGATVRCTVRLADLIAPVFPGTVTQEASARSTLDRYRERG